MAFPFSESVWRSPKGTYRHICCYTSGNDAKQVCNREGTAYWPIRANGAPLSKLKKQVYNDPEDYTEANKIIGSSQQSVGYQGKAKNMKETWQPIW